MIEIVTPPSAEPFTVSEAKVHLRETATGQDAKITRAIANARGYVEAITGRALINRTLRLSLPAFPREIILEQPPLASATQVTSVKYVDTDGTEQTLVLDTDYRVLAPSGPQAAPGRVILAYDKTWPTPRTQPDAVRITFVAGYGSTATSIPGPLMEAMELLIGDSYENREAQVAGVQISVNEAVNRILWPFRANIPPMQWC